MLLSVLSPTFPLAKTDFIVADDRSAFIIAVMLWVDYSNWNTSIQSVSTYFDEHSAIYHIL